MGPKSQSSGAGTAVGLSIMALVFIIAVSNAVSTHAREDSTPVIPSQAPQLPSVAPVQEEPSRPPTRVSTRPERASLSIGDEAQLLGGDGKDVSVYSSYTAFQNALSAVSANDLPGVQALVRTGQLILMKSRTRVRLLDVEGGFLSVKCWKVRILEAGTFHHQIAWVQMDNIQPIR